MKTVQDLVRLLDENNVIYSVNRTASSLSDAIQQTTMSASTLLVSMTAIEEYDSVHPERIVAIYLYRESKHGEIRFTVLTNNRETGVERFWIHREGFDSGECSICLQKIKKGRAKCSTCSKCICLTCYAKIASIEHEHSFKCPSCRTWNLTGYAFGTPCADLFLAKAEVMKTSDNAGFFSMFGRLDGLIRVMPRIKNKILFSLASSLTKLSGTERYCDGSPRHVMQKFVKFSILAKKGEDVRFYVERKTFKIHPSSQNPILEISAYRINVDGIVEPLAMDAWSLEAAYNRADIRDVHLLQVEYLRPERHEHARELLKTWLEFVLIEEKSNFGDAKEISCIVQDLMSFDVDIETRRITTMAVALAATLMQHFIEIRAQIKLEVSWSYRERRKIAFFEASPTKYATLIRSNTRGK